MLDCQDTINSISASLVIVYCEGAHPAILQKLMETNFEKVSGYGTDPYCASAKEKLRAACACPHGAPAHFMTMVKQRGALLAKGRLLGIQFDVLFTDGLYTAISKNAITTANVLKRALADKGYRFFLDSPTNQIFVILPNQQLSDFEGKAKFGFWEKYDDTYTVVRIATSWATQMEEVMQLIALL